MSSTSHTLPTIPLIGNPNSGKTTLFNQLTGANQKVGNHAGVTVELKTGNLYTPLGKNCSFWTCLAAIHWARIRRMKKSPPMS